MVSECAFTGWGRAVKQGCCCLFARQRRATRLRLSQPSPDGSGYPAALRSPVSSTPSVLRTSPPKKTGGETLRAGRGVVADSGTGVCYND